MRVVQALSQTSKYQEELTEEDVLKNNSEAEVVMQDTYVVPDLHRNKPMRITNTLGGYYVLQLWM